LVAEAHVLRHGRNLAVVECDVHDGRRMVAKALLTFSIAPRKLRVPRTGRRGSA